MVNVFRPVVLSHFDNLDTVESLVRHTNLSNGAESGKVHCLPLPVVTFTPSTAADRGKSCPDDPPRGTMLLRWGTTKSPTILTIDDGVCRMVDTVRQYSNIRASRCIGAYMEQKNRNEHPQHRERNANQPMVRLQEERCMGNPSSIAEEVSKRFH